MARVEEAAVVGAGPGTRAAVQEHDRAPFRIAGNFPVHGVAAVQVEPPLAERLDGRKQVLSKHRTGWIHRLLRSPFFRSGAPPSYRRRSEERPVGKEGVDTGRSRGTQP